MALIDLAQKAEQAFSQITTAEQDLNSLHHGDVARNALVQCYAFGVHAKRINTEFKSLCIERHIPPNGFNWTAAVRCVYGTFQPIEKGSNVTEWIVSPSNPVISKYARVLAHAENLKWDTKQLTKQLSQHGIENLVKEARLHDKANTSGNTNSNSGGTAKDPLFKLEDVTRINAHHSIKIDDFGLQEDAFVDGYASVLVRKEKVGYSIWATEADETIIQKVASQFTVANNVRDHLKDIMDLSKFTSSENLYVHNSTTQVQVTGVSSVMSFVAKGPKVSEFATGWFCFSKKARADFSLLIKHFGDAVFDWSSDTYRKNAIVKVSGSNDIKKIVADINEKDWKPKTTPDSVFQELVDAKPEYEDGTEHKVHLIKGNSVPLDKACIDAMKAVSKKDKILIEVKNGKINLVADKKDAKSIYINHSGAKIEIEGTVAKGLLNKASAKLPKDADVKMYLEDETLQFEFDHQGFNVRISV